MSSKSEPVDLMRCDDCKREMDHWLIDAWLSPSHPHGENADEPDAYLCERCFNRRGESLWGPWTRGP